MFKTENREVFEIQPDFVWDQESQKALLDKLKTHDIQKVYDNKDRLEIAFVKGMFFSFPDLSALQVTYWKNEDSDAYLEKESWFTCMTQSFPYTRSEEALNCFLDRLYSDVPNEYSEQWPGWKDVNIFVELNKSVDFKNHYHYLDMVLDLFWKRVFGKMLEEMWCSGIISAHGDKAYGYKSDWKEKGISFNRGVMLYLLTRTSLFESGDRTKVSEWVIEKYSQYLPLIEEAEAEAIKLNRRL